MTTTTIVLSFLVLALGSSCEPVKADNLEFGHEENHMTGAVYDLPTLGDIDLPILSDIISILINGTVHLIGNCTKEVDASRVTYWLVDFEGSLILLDDYDMLDVTQPVIYVLHGWGGNKDVDYNKIIWQTYHKVGRKNIIVMDYGAYADGGYQDAVCNAPYVAQNFARHMCEIMRIKGIYLEGVHVVGHSLGGQVAGMAGQRVKNMTCGSVGRITGLDPAGPLYQLTNTDSRLDKSDALFVDGIHTNMGQYGYIGAVGHIDFYPNCGEFQPGCLKVLANISLSDLLGSVLKYVSCNHQRSCYLFAESIERNDFRATSCPLCGDPLLCLPNTNSSDYVYMGESCTKPGNSSSYYVHTRDMYPFGEGPEAPASFDSCETNEVY